MKKFLYCIGIMMIVMFSFLSSVNVVNAAKEGSPGYTTKGEMETGNSDISGGCKGLLGSDFVQVLKEGYGWMEFFAIALLLVMGSLDFGKAITSDDSDGLKKAAKKFKTRLIIVVIIFILPSLVNMTIQIFLGSNNSYTNCIYD